MSAPAFMNTIALELATGKARAIHERDVALASLAERDATTAELRAALNKAAQGFTNLVEIGALSTKNEEIALELANQYRAIAKDTK